MKLIKSDAKTPAWADDVSKIYRIGYYSKQGGLDVVWLVNDLGGYEQATDQASLNQYFSIVEISGEDDFYGVDREALGPWSPAAK